MRVIVMGGGAAGLTSAIWAAKSGARVTVLERMKEPGKKILMSGGTRCNLLPVRYSPDDYFSKSMKSVKPILKNWPIDECRRWFTDEIGINLVEEVETNKWFPESNSAREVRDRLVERALDLGVVFRCNTFCTEISPGKGKIVVLDQNRHVYESDRLIVTAGGLSYPKVGTDGSVHIILSRDIGHDLEPTFPALTPLVGTHPDNQGLHGISLDVDLKVKLNGKEGFLFTHKGFSGPSVLNASHHFILEKEKCSLVVNWGRQPREFWEKTLRDTQSFGSKDVATVIGYTIPRRLSDAICGEANLLERKVTGLKKAETNLLIEKLTAYPLNITDFMDYKFAEVTGGGVSLHQINTKTMESKLIPGLFIAGELLDVFGKIGGFNFYWAWLGLRESLAKFLRLRQDSNRKPIQRIVQCRQELETVCVR